MWIQFPDKETFLDEEQIVYGYLADSEGEDEVIIYCAKRTGSETTAEKPEYSDQ